LPGLYGNGKANFGRYNQRTMLKLFSRIPALVLVGSGFIIGLLLAGALLAPRVVEFSPGDGAREVPSTSSIRLRFNRAMNRASVESRFSTDPPQSGQFNWDGQELTFTPDEPWPSGAQIEVRLRAGALGQVPLPMLRSKRWTYWVGQPRVLYLWPASGAANLYLIPPDQETGAIQLTFHPTGILDYALFDSGTLVVFSLNSENGGQSFYVLDLISGEERLIRSCDSGVRCSTPAVSPDGRWLAFTEQNYQIGSGGRTMPEGSRAWVLALEGEGELVPVSPAEHEARDPAWSPQGWLTYYDESLKATALLTFDQGPAPSPFTYVPNSLGAAGSWSPDGTRLVYPEIFFLPSQGDEGEPGSESDYYSHLYRTDVTTGETDDISPGSSVRVEDASPVYSPDGTRLAFARKFLDSERWTPGRQLWLLELDDGSAVGLTNESNFTFSSFNWNPDSTRLVYMRRDSSDLSRGPEIWLMDLATMEPILLVEGGYLPAWIP
jgi:Tol biopolymer transport system component